MLAISKSIKIFAILLGVLLCSAFGYRSVLIPSEHTSRKEDVDVNTGRKRTTVCVLGLTIWSEVEETPFSQQWFRHFGQYPKPVWIRVIRFPIFGHAVSVHYGYHGAFDMQLWIMTAFDLGTFDETTKREIISRFISYLQQGEPLKANDYAVELVKKVVDRLEREAETNSSIKKLR